MPGETGDSSRYSMWTATRPYGDWPSRRLCIVPSHCMRDDFLLLIISSVGLSWDPHNRWQMLQKLFKKIPDTRAFSLNVGQMEQSLSTKGRVPSDVALVLKAQSFNIDGEFGDWRTKLRTRIWYLFSTAWESHTCCYR